MESGMSTAVLGTTESTATGPFVATADAVSASFAGAVRHGIDIVIAFHRHEELVAPLVDSLVACAGELQGLGAGLVLINDSPDHEPLKPAIESARERLARAGLPVAVVNNAVNLGFVRSANIGLARAREGGRDALLLNSDTLVFPGAIAEMVRVAGLEPMIGFVSPRSNNATIASLPAQEEYRHLSPALAIDVFQRLSPHLPEYHHAPTCIGFCFLVRHPILARFGLFDESYGAGYSEENDLVMRANRHGYRAVLANRAFVHHRGNTSFGPEAREALEGRNSRLLAERYPEYPRAVRAYVAGPVHRAERMLAGLLPDASGRFDVLFDLSDIGGEGDEGGAFEKLEAVLREFAVRHAGDFNLFVMIPAGHALAHRIGAIAAVQVVPTDTGRTFAVGLRFGRLPTRDSVVRLNRLAVRTAWVMLDTTAPDRRSLNEPDSDWAWRQVFQHGDCIVYDGETDRPCVAPPADAAPEREWNGSADEIALMIEELLARSDPFAPLVRRLADTGLASSAPPVGGAGCRGCAGACAAFALSPALRRLVARLGNTLPVGPLRFVWHAWCRGIVRLCRERY